MMSRLGYLSMGLIAVGFLGLCSGCSSSSDDSPAPGQNNPEAGAPDGQAEASPDASPEASAEASAEASPDGDTADSPVESGPEAGTEQKACLDIHVGPELLGDPARWEDQVIGEPISQSPSQHVVAFDSKLYVFWMAKEKALPAEGTSSYRLVISAFDPQSGTHLKSTVLSPVPVGSDSEFSYTLSTSNNGEYALVQSWGQQLPGRPSNLVQRLVLGTLDGSVETAWGDLWDDTLRPVYQSVGWDGQGYVLHGYVMKPFDREILMLRVAPDGSVLTPVRALPELPKDIGTLLPHFQTFTQSDSGRTLLTNEDAQALILFQIHERDGSLAPGQDSSGWTPITGTGVNRWIAAPGAHRFLAWGRTNDQGYIIQSVTDQLSLEASLTFPGDPSPGSSSTEVVSPFSALEWQGKWHWVEAHYKWLQVRSWTPGQQSTGVHLLDLSQETCSDPNDLCWHDFSRTMTDLVAQGDAVWMGVLDQIPADASHEKARPFYRVLRVNEGCSYPANQIPVRY